MLVDTLKSKIKQAMLAKDTLTRDVLRVALGEVDTAVARAGEISNEEAEKIVRKIVKSNRESLSAIEGNPAKADDRKRLEDEIGVLESVLPTSLGPAEIEAALAPVADVIREAGNDGQAIGAAMKHLKGSGAVVDGKDVAGVVKHIRGA
jgi:uncharacterized protein YqeY